MTPAQAAWQEIARNAGFISATDRLRQTTSQKPNLSFCGIKIIADPIMPSGYFALVTDQSVTIVGPKGAWTIPAGLTALEAHEKTLPPDKG